MNVSWTISKTITYFPPTISDSEAFFLYAPSYIAKSTWYIWTKQNRLCIFSRSKKAFHTVDHKILLHKLQHYGISGEFLLIISSYLSNRHQCEEFMNIKSNLQKITMGLPQGSILGPLLVLLYINDILKFQKTLNLCCMLMILLCSLKLIPWLNYRKY